MRAKSPASIHDAENTSEVSAAEGSVILLQLSDIRTYEHNPRRSPNQEYDRIRASIRVQGLDQPLVVTKRPGDEYYIPWAGGNTRLKILRELYDETGEEQFLSIRCVYKPWTTESQALLAHLRENELRGNLSFIDKAHAVLEARKVLASELADPDISQRRLARLITDRGLSISHSMISKMSYAVDRLLPLIPQAFAAGMGKPQVEKLSSLERTCRQLWHHHALGSDTEFDETFAALCRRYDSPDWDIHSLVAALEHEIAEAADTSLHVIRLELEALMDGRGYVEVDQDSTDWQRESDQAASPGGRADYESGALAVEPCDTRRTSPEPKSTLDALRDHAFQLANQLAERNGFASVVTSLPDQGLGFLLTDVPDPDLANTLDPILLGQVGCLWWQLASCAELTTAPRVTVLALLDPASALYAALSTQDTDRVCQLAWTLDPGCLGDRLWRQLSDIDWRDLVQLMDTYRAMHKHAIQRGMPLWH